MPSEKKPFYDPIPPTYDEALATGSGWARPRSPTDERDATETEAQSLLSRPNNGASSSSRAHGYRAPTVETDDEDSLWDSDAESDEADQVRREMQEMEIEEPSRPRGSLWRKRIGFSLSLPKWKWSWRPRLPRLQIRLPSRPAESETPETSADSDEATETTTQSRSRCVPTTATGVMMLLTFARVTVVVIILGFLYLVFATDFLGGFSKRITGIRFNPEDVRLHVQGSVDPRRMRACVEHFSSYAHIAGTEGDYATAMDVESMFHRAGLDEVVVDEYFAYVNYPRKDGRAVQIMDAKGSRATWTAKLEEDEMGGETAGHQTYAFHAHSKSGDVRGPLIYANYGSQEDFKKLKDSGVDAHGAIALVRDHGTQNEAALKVKAAELAGFAGCIIYSDPADDGFLKGDVAPGGPFMPSDGVHRGAVSLKSMVIGDVLTPGWESKKETPRMKMKDAPGLPGIPSLPLAWRDAQVLLQHLKGFGQKVPSEWKGGVPDVGEWWTGNATSPIVRLKNEQDEIRDQPVWNVYGRIIGMEEAAKSIIIGNHRDALAFGATDPHTGTAVMIETARIFGDLVSRGWRPLRTIEFMSWDAAEYNLIGSTEYVEYNLEDIRANAFAYINLDTVVAGDELTVAGSPVHKKALHRAIGRIADPWRNATLKELWERRGADIDGLGADGDYAAFQGIAGTSSIELSFSGGNFPHRSSYDTFDLIDKITDPEFVYHGLMCQLVGLILLELADHRILPFDMKEYAAKIGHWIDDLEKWASKNGVDGKEQPQLHFKELKDAAVLIQNNAVTFHKWEDEWQSAVVASGGWEPSDYLLKRFEFNNKMSQFETTLLDTEFGGGIPNRTQFKHVVFGPQLWSSSEVSYFPAIRDTIEAKDWESAKRIMEKTAVILRKAAVVLEM
ncbi:hypothetical protein S7711_09471 [Stachybotrys chartarum IBT 7711]|uniref:Transferrin receptor-like dimerisation domain-containing protein n=1 Tax=Stachybotrys chartarum (strain CBS 109288 / IBT 7711) TaxID=1280523 RepID=A0A084APW2_STACB|nr:hypothetical protein S7711_09471 [Stachybotrys chartarum IBT 7711]KFA75051.1 hypothetical protein S40288_06558 [Stachybotrys chartarum IBT 40288]